MIICKLCIGQVQTAGVMDVMFQPMPSVVYLQNYEPRKTYQVPLFFRNLHVVTSIVGSVLDTVWAIALSSLTECFDQMPVIKLAHS